MELFGNFAILHPLVLTGLLSLPVIWWLLRVIPPSPARVRFPALVFLRGLKDEERDTAHTPWWLLLLRLLLAALFIAGLAGPVLNRTLVPTGNGPLVLMIDDSWAAAGHWDQRLAMATSLIRQAGEASRPIALVPTAPRPNPEPITLLTADQARARLSGMQPKPVHPDRLTAAARIRDLKDFDQAEIIWLSDGVESDKTGDLADRLKSATRLVLVAVRPTDQPLGLSVPEVGGSELQVQVVRGENLHLPVTGFIEAVGGDGQTERLIIRRPFTLDAGQSVTSLTIEMPIDLANQVTRLTIADQHTAGAVALLDDRWRRQRIGLVSGRSIEAAQPLLSDLYYLERAIATRAVIERGSVESLITAPTPPIAIILADVGRLSREEGAHLEEWIKRGGLLIRFAGPRLAALASASLGIDDDTLLPVRLRAGGRALGGALTWQTPQHLAPYPEDSPFAGLPLPDDVAITRQVLAEPDPALSEKTWARLKDGTPLVTSASKGRGRIVLIHVTANPQWSSLPLSGLYPDMLKRMLELAPGLVARADAPASAPSPEIQSDSGTVRPVRLIDAFGAWIEPADQRPIAADLLAGGSKAGLRPGLYEGTRRNSSRAVNMLDSTDLLTPLSPDLPVTSRVFYAQAPEIDFAPWLLLAAAMLLVLDTLISLALRGLLFGRMSTSRKAAAVIGLFALAMLPLLVPTSSALAQSSSNAAAAASDERALQAALTTRLGYIRTSNARIDRLSEAGLIGLTRIIGARTAIEAGAPMGLDPETDELVFFPLIYWPVLANQPDLTPAALQKIDRYLKHGGVILFDTRDEQSAPVYSVGGGVTPALAALRRLIGGLDLPPLEPVPDDHVLTKAFYLLQTFPGRWTGGEVWVEATSLAAVPFDEQDTPNALTSDGVSPIIIGSHDWAAAWAIDEAGRPLAELVPGGVRQRELAFRFGVNLVMYALTGNYKTDQVHIPALLERLGQ